MTGHLRVHTQLLHTAAYIRSSAPRRWIAPLVLLSLLTPNLSHALQAAFDNLNSGGYAGGTGWASNWVETNDGVTGPGAGLITNDGTRLVFTGGTPQAFITRAIDLSTATVALLRFDISSDGPGPMEIEDEFGVFVSSNGGGSFTQIRQFNFAVDRTNLTIDISEFVSAQTVIRFGVNAQVFGSTEFYSIDNVEVITEVVKLDFDRDELDGVSGNPMVRGDGIDGPDLTCAGCGSAATTSQPYGDDGVTIGVNPVRAQDGPGVMFDTANAVDVGQDPDLGAPNAATNANGDTCPNPTPGVLHGGDDAGVIGGQEGDPDAGATNQNGGGENCQPLGRLLIIQENGDNQPPDDTGAGGIITFDFDRATEFVGLVFLDDVAGTSVVTLCSVQVTPCPGGNQIGQVSISNIDDFAATIGENGKFFVNADDFTTVDSTPVLGVRRVEINLDSSGGIPNLYVAPPGVDLGDLPETGTSFATSLSNNGPSHNMTPGVTLRLGADIDSEGDGQPSTSADFDDRNANPDPSDFDDEDGVTLPVASSLSGVYTAAVVASNNTGSPALLCGWFDFDQSNAFNNTANTSTTGADPGAGSASDAGERSCITVPNNTSNGNFNVSWTIPLAERGNSGVFNFRFRITTDNNFRTSAPVTTGNMPDGEVEDYQTTINSLPVSLASFTSDGFANSLRVEWTTVSEAFNIGFDVWGRVAGEWVVLTKNPVLSKVTDAVTAQRYRTRIRLKDIDLDQLEGLALSSIDTSGDEELYGLFELGKRYGEQVLPEPIPWNAIRAEHDARMIAKGYVKMGRRWRKAQTRAVSLAADQAALPRAADLDVTEAGIQRVTYEDLRAAGLDLNGVRTNRIAVTLKGKGVPRRIRGTSGRFGPGGFIDFWGELPSYPDAIYVENYVYRVEINGAEVRNAGHVNRVVESGVQAVLQPLRVNEDNAYNFTNVSADPWYAALLRYPWGPLSYSADVTVDDALLADRQGRVAVSLSGVTDIQDLAPDHHVRVLVNGVVVAEREFDGRQTVTVEGVVPAGALHVGDNQVSVELGGATAAEFDLVFMDSVTLWYPRAAKASDKALLVEELLSVADGLTVNGLSSTQIVAYAHDDRGNLARLRVNRRRDRTTGTVSATVPTVADTGSDVEVSYWVSNVEALKRPPVLGLVANDDLLGEAAEYLILAHPSFIAAAADKDHPLSRYLAQRESQGWTIRVVPIDDIQAQYGGGMALPEAVTNFLRAADQSFDYSHVMLLGDDSYDYLDKLGAGSLSFIPTVYAKTTVINHTPSDGLLTDLDGDGIADKAVGRLTVRTLTDLEVMVAKTLAWEDASNGPRHNRSALWVADSEDPNVPSFAAQAERMIEELVTPQADGSMEAWPEENIDRVYFDQVTPAAGQTLAESAREQMIAAIEEGKTITGFNGHGSPTMWTFQGLLQPAHVSEIDNEGQPTLITTLTCYTSYFVSPTMDTLAHRLMKGYRVDASGNEIAGVANGAVAVHGAATLSGYQDNEFFAKAMVQAQLRDGATLGEALQVARRQAAALGLTDVIVNWALLGDPTLIIGESVQGK